MRTTSTCVLLLLITAGCLRQPATPYDVGESTSDDPGRDVSELHEVTMSGEAASAGSDETAESSARARPMSLLPPEPVLFRLGAGYGALGRVDLRPCRDQGLPAGYLHVRVTFRRSGRIVRAAVETPVAPPREALDCIGEQLEVTMVPIFDGADVTLSKSFFLN